MDFHRFVLFLEKLPKKLGPRGQAPTVILEKGLILEDSRGFSGILGDSRGFSGILCRWCPPCCLKFFSEYSPSSIFPSSSTSKAQCRS